jgi:hypothetical protein
VAIVAAQQGASKASLYGGLSRELPTIVLQAVDASVCQASRPVSQKLE